MACAVCCRAPSARTRRCKASSASRWRNSSCSTRRCAVCSASRSRISSSICWCSALPDASRWASSATSCARSRAKPPPRFLTSPASSLTSSFRSASSCRAAPCSSDSRRQPAAACSAWRSELRTSVRRPSLCFSMTWTSPSACECSRRRACASSLARWRAVPCACNSARNLAISEASSTGFRHAASSRCTSSGGADGAGRNPRRVTLPSTHPPGSTASAPLSAPFTTLRRSAVLA
mmetsp:Transcript_12693/g.37776  ORF Transcript_12693/g.37776 Transcript_12693/m.37776 type:complete len:235 (-) Transcript_12693:71-775(-)